MKTRRLLTIIAALSISLLVFLIAFNSVILGDEKASEPTTETLISQIQALRKEIEALEERISRLESGQKIPPTVPQVISPGVLQDLPPINTTPHTNQLPKGSQRREISGMTYYIIPLQDQNVVLPSHR